MIKTVARHLRAIKNYVLTPPPYRADYWKSLKKPTEALNDPLPWMNYRAIQYLNEHIRANHKVFEYGSGASTEYWLKKGCFVTSIEHDRVFYGNMKNKLQELCQYHLIEPEVSDRAIPFSPDSPDSFMSADFPELTFERYVKSIDTFEDESFDMVVVDGRARASCIKRAAPKIKRGGVLVLDNSDRNYYLAKNRDLLNGWRRQSFRGSVRGLLHFEETTVFHKP